MGECPFCGARAVADGSCSACQTAIPRGADVRERYRVNLRHGKGKYGNARLIAHSGLMFSKHGRRGDQPYAFAPLTNTDPEAIS